MNPHVIRAIFKRNFVSYFSNPTGYVFICVFVLLSSFAAFWPNDFFNSNLANLDQLNRYLPYILLVFVPAITMSIWADEKRQGTDELLLTIPAADFDVVLGKYLAAVAIYTVSLVFSFISNYLVLFSLGSPDPGLMVGTYFGYWIVGLAMLGIGMVASFLTGNLTVGFILGALFNAPLAFAGSIPESFSLFGTNVPLTFLRRFSIAEQFRDFSGGVISLASIGYFLGVVALMLYLSVVLIGRRHWRGGRDGKTMAGHYAARFAALAVVVVATNIFLTRHDTLRADVTTEGINSLAPQSRTLLKELDAKRPVVIEYFVSPTVPESYVQTRLNLLGTLRELQAAAGDKVQVIRHDVEPYSEEATRAEQQFGIKPVPVESRTRGARTREDIFMGLAFTCGLDKVVIPFLDRGIPVEYELVRSIATVSQQKRKKLGVLVTDAKLYGTFDMQNMSMGRNEQIIEELQKQYEVVQVDPTKPITEKYDVLLAVQPSSLGPEQMEHFIAAVKAGQPTAVFEDPFPFLAGDVPGTMAPKQPPGGMMAQFQRQAPQPKGDIAPLWKLLGVDFSGDNIVWQDYNPYPKLGGVPREWVFTGYGSGAAQPFNLDSPISAHLQQVLFIFPGSVMGLNSSQLKFTELVATSDRTGTIRSDQVLERNMMGRPQLNPEMPLLEKPTNEKYYMAAQIKGKLKDGKPPETKTPETKTAAEAQGEAKAEAEAEEAKAAEAKSDAKAGAAKADEAKAGEPEINVVLVGDIDCLYSAFFAVRARGSDPDEELSFQFDNVPFVLNVLDTLAGDERFVEIRTRRPAHRTLEKLNRATEQSKEESDKAREKFIKNYDQALAKAQKEFDDKIAALQKTEGMNPQQLAFQLMAAKNDGQRQLMVTTDRLKQQRDEQIKSVERKLTQEVRRVQDNRKMLAVLLPPIPLLAVAFIVFFSRRAAEREGVSKARLR